MELLVVILSVVVSLLVGFFVVLSDIRKPVNQIYGLLTLSFITLAGANYLSLHYVDYALMAMRATIFAATAVLALLYFLFLLLRPNHQNAKQHRVNKFVIWATLIAAAFDISPWVFSGLMISGGQASPSPAPGVAVFLAHFTLMVILNLRLLLQGVRHNRGVVRLQYTYILIGMVPTFVFAPITGVILPLVFHVTGLVFLTPIYATFFVCMIAYAMIRHQLFDIRLTAVRSAAYVGVLLTLSAIYYALAYITSLAFHSAGASGIAQVDPWSIVIALILAFLFQPIKHFFDKLTNGIFYRDNYNTDDFFARINRELNTTTDLRSLLQRAAVEIGATIKGEQSFFFIRFGEGRFMMAGMKGHQRLPMSDIAQLDAYVAEHGKGVIVADLLSETDKMSLLMAKYKLGIILPLRMSGNSVDYLFLGTPRSRNYTRRDIRLLETISDELVIAIQNALSIQDVEEINLTLQQRIEDATKELRRSNAQLQRLDTAKDEFISMASHQLRTPLTSVKGYLSMVLEGDAGKITDMQQKLLSEAFVSSERMVHLISDFLNVSRLQTGKFMLEQHAVDLAKITAQEVDSLQTIAKSHDLKLKFKAGARLPILYLDENKIRQVIMNFIDNAIYYSREFTTITVSLNVDAGNVLLEVHDTGIGVPESEQAHLFTKFFRATNARKQRPDGTGVGLFLAKKVIVAHSGTMVFTSVEGKGSVFGFRLPIKKLQSAPAHQADHL
jgi:signal transduction histidine kinase